jgi:Flp pilus assembly protein TadD
MNRLLRQRRAVPFVVLLVLILAMVTTFSVNAPIPSGSPAPTDNRQPFTRNRQQGRVMQALYHVEVQAAREGWTAALARAAGDLWREAGDWTNAAAYWEMAAAAEPSDTSLLRQIAQAYIALQQWTHAVDTLERLVQLEPNEAWAHYQLGLLRAPLDAHNARQHLSAAVTSLDYSAVSQILLTTIDTYGSDPVLLSMRVGVLFMDFEMWAHAELAFSQAALIAQPFPEALAYTALARDWQGKDSTLWLEQALQLAPDNALVRYVEGLHWRLGGDNPRSLEALLRAVTLEPANPAYCAELGTAYRLTGDLESALLWLQQAVILSNNAPEFQRLLALLYAEEAAALALLGVDVQGQISTLTPNDPDVLAELGWSMYTAGDSAGAQAQISTALALDPQNPRALYYRARILLSDGDTVAAVPLLQIVAASTSALMAEARRLLADLGY